MKKIQYNGESKLLSGIATKINWLIDQVGTKIDASEKGVANGVATLDGGGKVPSSQLPSYVDDVVEGYYYNSNFYEDSAHTQLITPETSKIYVDLPTNKSYRWGGSEYVEISSCADEKVKQSPINDYVAHEVLLAKSTDGLEHTEETYKSSGLKFQHGASYSQFFIGDYDSQSGFYNSDVYCKWVYCYGINATELTGVRALALGNSQAYGIFRMYNDYAGIVDVYVPTDIVSDVMSVYLPSSSGQLALKSEIPTNVSELTDDIGIVKWSEQNLLGAKNLLPFPYREITNTKNGITFTVNADYSVTVSSGSPSANTNWYFRMKEDFLPSGKYIVSGFNDTAQGNAFCLRIVINQDMSDTRTYNDYGSGTEITVNDGDVVSIYLHMGTSGVSSGNKHYVMVRPSTVEDSTYQEPTLTNRQLTDKKTSWEQQNVLGAKNLLTFPYYHGFNLTANNVVFTVDDDGTITVGGTQASANTTFWLMYNATLPNGTYTLSDGGVGTEDTYLSVRYYTTSSASAQYYDVGTKGSVTFTVDNWYRVDIRIWSRNGKTADNLVFKPMLRLASIADNTFEPYAETNRQLTLNKISCDEYTASGVKNYFKYPFYPHPIGVEQYTQRGVLFTDNGDGGLKANGVNNNDGNSYCQLIPDSVLYPSQFLKLPKGKYHFSGGISADYYMNLSWGLETSPTSRTVIETDYGDGFDFEVTEEQSKNNIYVSFAFVKQGKTADNVVFYPSITRLEYRDSGYVNHAMTNLQLTNNKVDKEGYILDDEDLNDLIYPGFYLARNDNHILNKPSGFNQFALIVSRTASSAQYYNQRLIRPNADGEVYSRNCVNGVWTSWVKEYSVWNSDNYLGVKNLLPYRYYNNSGLITRGVTFTVNEDGTVTCSGTSTGDAVFNVTQREVNGGLYLPNGTYIMNGCPEGGSTSGSAGNYQMKVSRTVNGAQSEYGTDAGNGVSFTVNGDDFGSDGAWVRVYIVCRNTVVTDNLVFKPMVRLSNVSDSEFIPPADSNRKLSAERLSTDEIAPKENGSNASKAYAVGDYMIRNGKLYRVTVAIASGGKIISTSSGANITKTTLGEELKRALT